MSVSMYAASVPIFDHYLRRLSAILDKAEAHAIAHKIDPAALLQARLFPDMSPFIQQVRTAADFARRTCAPLVGMEIPAMDNTEQTFSELKQRIARTRQFLADLTPAQFEDSAERTIASQAGLANLNLKGTQFLFDYALPNFYFHFTTAYAILRNNGVALGKGDFDGHHLY